MKHSKRMKPVLMLAVVNKGGMPVSVCASKDDAECFCVHGYRVARVRVTEVPTREATR